MTPEIAARENAACRQTWGTWGWKDNTKAKESGRNNGAKSKAACRALEYMREVNRPVTIPEMTATLKMSGHTLQYALANLRMDGIAQQTGQRGPRGAKMWVLI